MAKPDADFEDLTPTADELRDPHNVQTVFVNELAGSGFLNGVVNLTFSTAQFTPIENVVALDRVVASRIRMDLTCAMELRNALDRIISESTAPTPKPMAAAAADAGSKPN